MKKIKLSGALALVFLAVSVHAQFGMGGGMAMQFSKCKIVSGDVSLLKGKTFKTTFIYDGMTVGKKKTEEEYVKEKVAKYNEKEPGRGDNWAKAWVADRKSRFEPHFFQKFNELGAETQTQASADQGEWQLEVKTIYTDPGWNIGIDKKPATINAICTFRDNTGKEVAVVNVFNVPGQEFGGFDFETGVRLAECYEKCGKDLYRTISKEFKKK
ncbi:MAG: hypothetical protein U0T84_05175 [Chitinophagales bacterium]